MPTTPSDPRDPDTWRLKVEGLPYRIITTRGTFGREESSAKQEFLVRATDLYAFAVVAFPPPVFTAAGPQYPLPARIPGTITLRGVKYGVPLYVDTIDWEEFVPGSPIDPFSADTIAPTGTYGMLAKMTANYKTVRIGDTQNPNPQELIEINGKTNTEVITSTAPAAKGDGSALKDPSTLIPVPIYTEQWTLKFPLVAAPFANQWLGILRGMQGRVNSSPFPLLFNAPAETLLFASFDYDEKFTWQHGVETPPVQITLTIEEKAIPYSGGTAGHNHYWIPGKGWQYITNIDSNGSTRFLKGNFGSLIPF